MLSWKMHVFPKREKSEKADQLFEIALLLITVLSASIFQCIWSKYSFENTLTNAQKLADLSFSFKELTIPIIILISFWLLKELISGTSSLSLRLKRYVKEFCWAFLSIFLALEILSVVFLGFIMKPYQLSIVGFVMVLFAFLSTFPITVKYRGHISVEAESKKREVLTRFGDARAGEKVKMSNSVVVPRAEFEPATDRDITRESPFFYWRGLILCIAHG
jgi:cellulose synthase/poly-beta-1,6-N-acetylglucosamine synthase-like glycosyltransferase